MGFIYDLKLTSTLFLLIAKSTVHHYLSLPSLLSLCRCHTEPEYIFLLYTPGLSVNVDLLLLDVSHDASRFSLPKAKLGVSTMV